MKKYVDFNIKKRMNATNDFEKDFFNGILFMKRHWKI